MMNTECITKLSEVVDDMIVRGIIVYTRPASERSSAQKLHLV